MAKRYVKIKGRKIRMERLLAAALALVALAVLLVVGLSSCRRDAAPDPGDALLAGVWYGDELGLIEDDKALVKGMETFEKRTGVQPYLSLIEDVDPEELSVFAEDQYDALFTDGAHLLVVYDEWEEGVYYLAARAGESSSLSEESVDRVLSSIEAAYADPAHGTYADAFGAGFADGAKALTASASSGVAVGLLVALGLSLLVLCGALVLLLRRRARAARRDAYMEEED